MIFTETRMYKLVDINLTLFNNSNNNNNKKTKKTEMSTRTHVPTRYNV